MKIVKRILAMTLGISLLFSLLSCSWLSSIITGNGNKPSPDSGNGNTGGNTNMLDLSELTVNSTDTPLKLWYDEEAPFINECSPEASMMEGQDIGWQNWSLPLGNGYFGANVFGRVDTERVQITEKTLSNPWQIVKVSDGVTSWPQVAGLNNFSETYIDFGHNPAGVSNYSRSLDLRTSVAHTSYDYQGASYSREYFVSYPDRALVIRLDAENGPLSFTLRPTIPFEQSYMNDPGDGLSKTGTVVSKVEGDVGCIEISGTLGYYDVDFVGYYRVYTTGGSVTADTVEHKYVDSNGKSITDIDGVIRVDGASSAIIVATFGTDYELCPENFENGQYSHNKQTASTDLDDARDKVSDQLYAFEEYISEMNVDEAYSYLKDRHLADYQELFGRVDLNLDFEEEDLALTTDALLNKYNRGTRSAYLEALLFQYGRYLIIASSREGALPANLQGAWNCYNVPAWSSGYWSNINIQMNYWHVFSTNLEETFIPYVDYTQTYMPVAEENATNLIATHNPAVFNKDGGNGWTMGVSGNPFFFNGDRSCGNLGLLTQLFYEYYEFTKDEEVLKTVYDILANAARFVTKCVKDYDGKYLVEYCDSPEMYVNGSWYYTTGTTYAQTLAYINNYAALRCAKELGIDLTDSELLSSKDYSILSTILEQIDKYDPINVGLSGQIKEFREEDYYCSLGNPNHRHISQLVGLFPGNIINSSTEAWLDAALVSLAGRNEGLTDWPSGTTATNEASIVAWSWAHKQALYARAGEGDMALEMLAGNLRNSTLENLLMVCGKIFQIEASSGTTAAFAEMILQSDEGFIEILPAIPTCWKNGSYTGMVARGNFEVSVAWEDGLATKINLLSRAGGIANIKYPEFSDVKVYNSLGESVSYEMSEDKIISFETNKGETYYIVGFEKLESIERPDGFGYERTGYADFNLSWNPVLGAEKYNIYIAYENDATYTLVGSTSNTSYNLKVEAGKENLRKTFVVTAVRKGGIESKRALCYSNPIEVSLELYSLSWSVSDGKLNVKADANDNAGTVRLYEKAVGNYVLVAEEKALTISYDYNPTRSYAISVVSKYTGEESTLMPLTPGNNADNLLNGKDMRTSDSDGKLEVKVDLGEVYALDELRIYIEDSTLLGDRLVIERLYQGEWHTAILCQSREDILAHLSDSYLAFDLGGGKANKIRITYHYDGDESLVSDITLGGSRIDNEKVELENVFANKQFTPSNDSAGNIYSASYGYQTLTDGIIYEESNGRYSSKLKGGKVEATINLGDVYTLSEFKIYLYKDGLSKFGNGLQIQILFNGEWTTFIDCQSESELAEYLVKNPDGVGDWLVFMLDDVYASKIKFTIPAQTDSGWTTVYEMECYGVKSTVIDTDAGSDPSVDPTLIGNVFANKQFIPTAEALAEVLTAGWWQGGGYEALTDGNRMEDQVGRFSTKMNNTTVFMDATIDLGGNYELQTMKFYIYDAAKSSDSTKKASVGKDLLIQVYSDGSWHDVVVCANNSELTQHLVIEDGLSNDYLQFDLEGAKAEKLRIYISGAETTDGITFQEIECSAK